MKVDVNLWKNFAGCKFYIRKANPVDLHIPSANICV